MWVIVGINNKTRGYSSEVGTQIIRLTTETFLYRVIKCLGANVHEYVCSRCSLAFPVPMAECTNGDAQKVCVPLRQFQFPLSFSLSLFLSFSLFLCFSIFFISLPFLFRGSANPSIGIHVRNVYRLSSPFAYARKQARLTN